MARLPDPPQEYSKAYMEALVRELNQQLQALQRIAHLRGADLNLSKPPAAAAGLRSGDVWQDPAAAHTLKIVP